MASFTIKSWENTDKEVNTNRDRISFFIWNFEVKTLVMLIWRKVDNILKKYCSIKFRRFLTDEYGTSD
jgi:hypothetical protein